MAKHLADSLVFSSIWSHPMAEKLFDEQSKINEWVRILICLAKAQAKIQIIPAAAATNIEEKLSGYNVPLDEFREKYELSGHSLSGLLEILGNKLSSSSREYLCYGATVQDITDSWLALVLKKSIVHLVYELFSVENHLIGLTERYSRTPILGRTHGQPGLVITAGYKFAIWLNEVRSLIEKFKELLPGIAQGQLCGGSGAVTSYGEKGFEVQSEFCSLLGLNAPVCSWTSSRNHLFELAQLIVRMSSTFEKIGHEIYLLQQPEINELAESASSGHVHSITMPQKVNPEGSEHLGTLGRCLRSSTRALEESLVHDHERDGRSWKVEWLVYPELLTLSFSQISLVKKILSNLRVNADEMLININRQNGFCFAEAVLYILAPSLGLRTAQDLVRSTIALARTQGKKFIEVCGENPQISTLLSPEARARMESFEPNVSNCASMANNILVRCKQFQISDKEFRERNKAAL